MHRRNSYTGKTSLDEGKFGGLSTLNILFLALLILGFNKLQQQEITQRFVAEYGFYGQSLSLTKDQQYIHRYFGCSQSRGINKGEYSISHDTLRLQLTNEKQKVLLSELYLLKGGSLISIDSNAIFTSVSQYGYW